jgi:peptidyl-prolyl cis-trans isomerase SurA
MAVDVLPPAVYFAIEHLAPGTISEPLSFTAHDNREAMRLLFLEERIPPHQANLTQDYTDIQQLLIEKKRETALQAWFDRTRANTKITVAPEYEGCALLR